MNHANFLSHVLSTPQAQKILKYLNNEAQQDLIWLLKEAHIWGYFQDFPDLEEEMSKYNVVLAG